MPPADDNNNQIRRVLARASETPEVTRMSEASGHDSVG